VSIDGYEDVPENDEAALMKAVSKQPVSVAICASGGLQFYSSGVVDGKCCTELDHGVLAVGYGVVCYLCLTLRLLCVRTAAFCIAFKLAPDAKIAIVPLSVRQDQVGHLVCSAALAMTVYVEPITFGC